MKLLFGDLGTLAILLGLTGINFVMIEKKISSIWRWLLVIFLFYMGMHGLFASDQGEVAKALKPTLSVIILLGMFVLRLFRIKEAST